MIVAPLPVARKCAGLLLPRGGVSFHIGMVVVDCFFVGKRITNTSGNSEAFIEKTMIDFRQRLIPLLHCFYCNEIHMTNMIRFHPGRLLERREG